jgi:hypothetical protein
LSRKFLGTKTLGQKPRELPRVELSRLQRMNNSSGIFAHAIFSVLNFNEGYCADDNAPAFAMAVPLGSPDGSRLQFGAAEVPSGRVV